MFCFDGCFCCHVISHACFYYGHPLFFLRLASSDRPSFLALSKKKSEDVVKPLFTWNNSFNLKNEDSNNSCWKVRDACMSHRSFGGWSFFPRCLNFTITSTNFSAILILGSYLVVSRLHSNDAWVPGLLFRDFLWFFI